MISSLSENRLISRLASPYKYLKINLFSRGLLNLGNLLIFVLSDLQSIIIFRKITYLKILSSTPVFLPSVFPLFYSSCFSFQ